MKLINFHIPFMVFFLKKYKLFLTDCRVLFGKVSNNNFYRMVLLIFQILYTILARVDLIQVFFLNYFFDRERYGLRYLIIFI